VAFDAKTDIKVVAVTSFGRLPMWKSSLNRTSIAAGAWFCKLDTHLQFVLTKPMMDDETKPISKIDVIGAAQKEVDWIS
jgi:hypothetical protein